MKELAELDSLYKEKMIKLNSNDRIVYCENLIDSLQSKLIKRRKSLKTVDEELNIILTAAQQELKSLQKSRS